MYILFHIFSIIVYHRILTIVPCIRPCYLSILCIIVCICKSQTLSSPFPKPPAHSAITSVLYAWVSFRFIKVHLCHILGSTYKQYHMVFVFLFLTHLSSSMLMRMTLFHSFLWLSNILLCVCATSSLSIHVLMEI